MSESEEEDDDDEGVERLGHCCEKQTSAQGQTSSPWGRILHDFIQNKSQRWTQTVQQVQQGENRPSAPHHRPPPAPRSSFGVVGVMMPRPGVASVVLKPRRLQLRSSPLLTPCHLHTVDPFVLDAEGFRG